MTNVHRFAGFEFDAQQAALRRPGGEIVRLRPKPLNMLQFLITNAGRVVTKQELMEAVSPNVHVGEDSLFQCIREIRSAIGDDRRQLIKVISGRGYLFDADAAGSESATDSTPASAAAPSSAPSVPAAADLPPAALIAEKTAGFFRFGPRSIAVAASVAICAVGLAVAAPYIGHRVFTQPTPVLAVTPFADANGDPRVALMAANVTDSLVDGLSRIPNIRVLAPVRSAGPTEVSARTEKADLILRGELQQVDKSWTVQARIIDAATNEVRWTTSFAVDAGVSPALQQSRLTAGVGYPLAVRISSLIHSDFRRRNADVVVDQAQAFINRTSREKSKTAQEMLDKALAADPDNVDLQAALAAQLLRGIQTAWYRDAEAEAAENRARGLLESAIKREPNYMPLLEGYCRFLAATNHFVDSLIACAKALNQDPWDGLVLFQVGLSQMQLGRFDDALASFQQADSFDTPEVSRWTWLLGAGYAYIFLDRSEEALPWLERSLAVTPGTGRTHFLLAAAYQRLGRTDDARAAVAAGMKLRPGTTLENVGLPKKNASEIYLSRAREVNALLAAAGIPEK
jgi:DNA-binding winged helix-turn-helix (wHTH) protein/TolB-like protein/Tfp pilus assembly protein PilF